MKHQNKAWNPATATPSRNYSRFEQPKSQEHAQLRRGWVWSKPDKDYVLVRLGCDCRGCSKHLELIHQINPERWESLWNPPKPEDVFFRPKKSNPEQWFSRNRGKTLNRFSVL